MTDPSGFDAFDSISRRHLPGGRTAAASARPADCGPPDNAARDHA